MNCNGKGDADAVKMEEKIKGKLVYMWGYLPGALPQRSPLTAPVAVRVPSTTGSSGDSWKDVYGGGCGFAMAISGALSLCHCLIFVFSLVMWVHSFFFLVLFHTRFGVFFDLYLAAGVVH